MLGTSDATTLGRLDGLGEGIALLGVLGSLLGEDDGLSLGPPDGFAEGESVGI